MKCELCGTTRGEKLQKIMSMNDGQEYYLCDDCRDEVACPTCGKFNTDKTWFNVRNVDEKMCPECANMEVWELGRTINFTKKLVIGFETDRRKLMSEITSKRARFIKRR